MALSALWLAVCRLLLEIAILLFIATDKVADDDIFLHLSCCSCSVVVPVLISVIDKGKVDGETVFDKLNTEIALEVVDDVMDNFCRGMAALSVDKLSELL